MVVREDVGARGLWEWRCLKERQKWEIGDPVIAHLRIKESYFPLATSCMKCGQHERPVSGKVILRQWLIKSMTKLISSFWSCWREFQRCLWETRSHLTESWQYFRLKLEECSRLVFCWWKQTFLCGALQEKGQVYVFLYAFSLCPLLLTLDSLGFILSPALSQLP